VIVFRDRQDAGRRLAARLGSLPLARPQVLALPGGGVPVGYEIARALRAPMDVWLVRKIAAAGLAEPGLGAVAETGYVYLNHAVLESLRPSSIELGAALSRARRQLDLLSRRLRGAQPPPALAGRSVILVDDGVATGGTMRAAVDSVRAQRPRLVVLALPVAGRDTVDALAREADRTICLYTPDELYAVSVWYSDYCQVGEREVVDLLRRAQLEAA
jgi:putative phosphoribosyl transferase